MLFLALQTLRKHEEVLNPLNIFEVLLVEIQVMRHKEVRQLTVECFSALSIKTKNQNTVKVLGFGKLG